MEHEEEMSSWNVESEIRTLKKTDRRKFYFIEPGQGIHVLILLTLHRIWLVAQLNLPALQTTKQIAQPRNPNFDSNFDSNFKI